MRNFYLILAFMFAAFSASADNYFTMGTNDSVRIHPMFLGNGYRIPVKAHFDGRLDYWHLDMTYPAGLSFNSDTIGPGMYVPFINRWGTDTMLVADLITLQNGGVIMSTITEPGYHDPDGDGNFDTYGTVKWEAGDYDEMFSILFIVNSSFRSGTISIDGLLSSTHDWRGGIVGYGVTFFRSVTVWVGYQLGDVNGDEVVNIADVTALANYVMSQTGFNEFQMVSGDINQDGILNISDVTALIHMVLDDGSASIEDINDLLPNLFDM